MNNLKLCDNINCKNPDKKQKVSFVVLTDEFINETCYWCDDCLKRDKQMVKSYYCSKTEAKKSEKKLRTRSGDLFN